MPHRGREVHVYGLVSNDEGMWAETTYVGSLVCSESGVDSDECGVMSEECGMASGQWPVISGQSGEGKGQEAVGNTLSRAPGGPPSPQ